MRVQVSRVDLDGRKIDFRMVHDGAEDAALARAHRGRASKAGSAVAELAAVKAADRAVKAEGRGRSRAKAGGEASGGTKASARKSTGSSSRRR